MKIKIAIPALLTAFTFASIGRAAESAHPNILLIVADDLGYGDLGVQGYNKDIPTPNIDKLARGGVRFTDGYVSAPICSPSRAGLMTGRYQERYGHELNNGPAAEMRGATFGLPLSQTTLGNRLEAAGYVTGWFGKSHLGFGPKYRPQNRGFDVFYGFLGGLHSYLDDDVPMKGGDILRGNDPVKNYAYTTAAYAHETADFITAHKDQPWFAYLAFNAVHVPLEATPKYLARFPDIKEKKRKIYAGMLSAMDDAVGMLRKTLKESGQDTNTLIFFISDNGGPTMKTTSSNGPLRGYKGDTWEGGIRVPMIVNWEGHIPAGKVDSRPMISLDIFPTALAAAGIEADPSWKLDGVNLLPYLAGEKTGDPHQALFWRCGDRIAVRMGDWKLVKSAHQAAIGANGPVPATTDGAELYNLAKDIGEKTNLAAQYPEKVKELSDAWNHWNADNIPPLWWVESKKGKPQADED